MPSKETIEFVQRLLTMTWEDPTLTVWEKFKFSVWLFMVTTPVRPPIF